MICPKCKFEQAEGNPECKMCGVIFAKLTPDDFLDTAAVEEYPASSQDNAGRTTLRDIFLESGEEDNPFYVAGRAIAFIIIFIWSLKFIAARPDSESIIQSFLHNINLPFHEAGHLIFAVFGSFLGVLGGTLGQILMPLICAGAFIYYRNPFAASIALWWTGQSFLDIAPYIYDAQALKIMLLGGITGMDDPDFHDWHVILSDLKMLPYDHALAWVALVTGKMLMVLALAWGGYVLFLQYKKVKHSL